ncbi:MAG: DUF3501 family protein [Alphaproteobacteria bacterium]|nr:DUF3501 family protein [Alphaproteobacteria bacterium]
MRPPITREDILPLNKFLEIRPKKQKEIIEIKKHRRISVGPDITFYFESYDTIWWQIHEMLRIERGGEEQIEDELEAYVSLIPHSYPDQSHDLVATMMIEIDNPDRRQKVLSQLGGIEESIFIKFEDYKIKAKAEADIERTDETGKTSSVHFLHFLLDKHQIHSFIQPGQDIIIEITHPHYAHKALLSEGARQALSRDLLFFR